jgi:EAL domain-containing protein (putative c-di-GMP-specific phosphodiesterase class I)
VALLAHNLGYTVIAEGVETADELLAVSELGCEFAQGYMISAALPHAELAALISTDCHPKFDIRRH